MANRGSTTVGKPSMNKVEHLHGGVKVFANSEGRLERVHGMHWLTTAVFLTGELAGAGVISLPIATRNLGIFPGLAIMCGLLVMSAYTAELLGKSWLILLKHWPVYHRHCKNPYAEMGDRALGRGMRVFVELNLNYGFFFVGCLMMVMVSTNLVQLIKAFWSTNFSYCLIALIVAAAILPSFYLRSPENFCFLVNISMLCTLLAVITTMVGMLMDMGVCDVGVVPVDYSLMKIFGGFGTMFFACSGHAVFPIIQHDMRQPYLFSRASKIAFCIVAVMYLPLMLLSNLVYGDNVRRSIIDNLGSHGVQQTVNVFITIHCALITVLVANPMNQMVDKWLKAPYAIGWKRIFGRSLVMLAALFVVETLPKFGPFMDLMGATCTSMTSYILPTIFFFYLNAIDRRLTILRRKGAEVVTMSPSGEESTESTFSISSSSRSSPAAERIIVDNERVKVTFRECFDDLNTSDKFGMTITMTVAVLVLIYGTISGVEGLVHSQFMVPCWLTSVWPWKQDVGRVSSLYCCGIDHNKTLAGQYCISAFEQ